MRAVAKEIAAGLGFIAVGAAVSLAVVFVQGANGAIDVTDALIFFDYLPSTCA